MDLLSAINISQSTAGDIILKGFAVVILVFLLGLLGVFFKATSELIRNKILGTKPKKKDTYNCRLDMHPFFHRCDMMIQYKVNEIDFGGKVRNELFRDMLRSKIQIFKDNIADFIKKDFDNVSDWSDDIIMTIDKTVKEYNHAWVELGAPELAIEKFHEWHEDRVTNAKNYIYKIGLSKFYDTIYKKNMSVMDTLIVLFNQTCEDMFDAAFELNGTLTDKIYKGQKIEPLTKHLNDKI